MKDLPTLIPIKDLKKHGGPGRTKCYELLKKGEIEAKRLPWGTHITGASLAAYLAKQPKYVHVPPGLEDLKDVL